MYKRFFIIILLTLVMWYWAIGSASAEECPDIIVDGREVTIGSGCYGIIFVKNNGMLNVKGNIKAQTVRIQWGTVKVIPYSDSIEGSGTFVLECDQLTTEKDGSINANSAGGDTRGIGADINAFVGTGGGGYGGKGSKGDTGAGGNTYGDNFPPTIEMGSRGGNNSSHKGGKGGGSISIISKGDVAIYGKITANGGNGGSFSSGGSGGGVLIHTQKLELTGSIAANGGKGKGCGGGGGGGRIKLFYLYSGGQRGDCNHNCEGDKIKCF